MLCVRCVVRTAFLSTGRVFWTVWTDSKRTESRTHDKKGALQLAEDSFLYSPEVTAGLVALSLL